MRTCIYIHVPGTMFKGLVLVLVLHTTCMFVIIMRALCMMVSLFHVSWNIGMHTVHVLVSVTARALYIIQPGRVTQQHSQKKVSTLLSAGMDR